MNFPVVLSIDSEGRPRARWTATGPVHQVLPEWLEVDLGQNGSYVSFLLDQARRVRDGEVPGWEGSGNAFSVLMGPASTVIETLYPRPDSSPIQIETTDLIDILEQWQSMLGALDEIA